MNFFNSDSSKKKIEQRNLHQHRSGEELFCYRLGEQQVVIQSVVYHIGFKRKPAWLEGV